MKSSGPLQNTQLSMEAAKSSPRTPLPLKCKAALSRSRSSAAVPFTSKDLQQGATLVTAREAVKRLYGGEPKHESTVDSLTGLAIPPRAQFSRSVRPLFTFSLAPGEQVPTLSEKQQRNKELDAALKMTVGAELAITMAAVGQRVVAGCGKAKRPKGKGATVLLKFASTHNGGAYVTKFCAASGLEGREDEVVAAFNAHHGQRNDLRHDSSGAHLKTKCQALLDAGVERMLGQTQSALVQIVKSLAADPARF